EVTCDLEKPAVEGITPLDQIVSLNIGHRLLDPLPGDVVSLWAYRIFEFSFRLHDRRIEQAVILPSESFASVRHGKEIALSPAALVRPLLGVLREKCLAKA